MPNLCKLCGVNLDMTGKAHRCVPVAVTSAVSVPEGVIEVTGLPDVALPEDVPVGGGVTKRVRRVPAKVEARIRVVNREVLAGVRPMSFPATAEMRERLEDYRAGRGLRSISAAIRELLERGLK